LNEDNDFGKKGFPPGTAQAAVRHAWLDLTMTVYAEATWRISAYSKSGPA
jgi:hypothetical protein